MRRPSKAVKCSDGYLADLAVGGKLLKQVMDYLIEDPGVFATCTQALGSKDPDAAPAKASMEAVRDIMRSTFPGPASRATEGENNGLRADLLHRWATAASDPDAGCIHRWLTEGASGGREVNIEDDGGTFPPREDPDLPLGPNDGWAEAFYGH